MSAPSRRDLVRYLIDKGFSERRSLRFVGMSPSSFRYSKLPSILRFEWAILGSSDSSPSTIQALLLGEMIKAKLRWPWPK